MSPICCNDKGVALDGYDMVAYFRENRPVKGLAKWSSKYREFTWYLSSEENKALFDAKPEEFMPEFGGYCAYAAAAASIVKGHGKHGVMCEGRLYFSVNKRIKKRYLKEPQNYNERAYQNWPDLQKELES